MSTPDSDVTLRLGRERIRIHKRYETLSIVNDFLIGIWFLAGSLLLLDPARETFATWLFIIGSGQFLIRPLIRLIQHVHVGRLPLSASSD